MERHLAAILAADVVGCSRLVQADEAATLRVWRWEGEAAPGEATARTPERLSIAVRPFNNMSADPEQEFLADGLSEDIVTGLSKIRWFLVIARNSTFTYKGQAVDVKRVAKELGAL